MNTSDAYPWLVLNQIESLPPKLAVQLAEKFGSAQNLLKASKQELRGAAPLSEQLVELISGFNDEASVARELRFIEDEGIHLIHYLDPAYPEPLKQLPDFPFLLFAQGRIDLLDHPRKLAFVGSRYGTSYGREVITKLIPPLVREGVSIVSGFAIGVDIFSHLTTLDCGGSTLCVVGGGLGCLYPASHRRYRSRVLENGLFLSEYPIFKEAKPYFFPQRNRIISGLSQGVVVIEAKERSGALITASLALNQNREVFAVPGSIFSETSRGCLRLIQQGAKLVHGAQDILDEFGWTGLRPSDVPLKLVEPDQTLYQFCQQGPRSVDEMAEKTGLTLDKIQWSLSRLELKGLLRRHPGAHYQSL